MVQRFQVETIDTFIEASPVSLQKENAYGKEVCYHNILSHLEKTGICIGRYYGSLKVNYQELRLCLMM